LAQVDLSEFPPGRDRPGPGEKLEILSLREAMLRTHTALLLSGAALTLLFITLTEITRKRSIRMSSYLESQDSQLPHSKLAHSPVQHLSDGFPQLRSSKRSKTNGNPVTSHSPLTTAKRSNKKVPEVKIGPNEVTYSSTATDTPTQIVVEDWKKP
jgi:hypothetical protein